MPSVFLALVLVLIPVAVDSQTGSISGTVTAGGKPARGVKVVAIQGGPQEKKLVAVDVTDADGRYRLRDVPAGQTSILIGSPMMAIEGNSRNRVSGRKDLTLSEGEEIEAIDFRLVRGGVITGRIFDSSGRAIIGERVIIQQFNEKRDSLLHTNLAIETDDRGVYRIYGIPPGRYKVSVGLDKDEIARPDIGRIPVPRTYYPGVVDASKGEVIEIEEGSEIAEIDIKVSRAQKTKTFMATGRIIDAQTGKLLPRAAYTFQEKKTGQMRSYGESDSRGEFRIDGLLPGSYTLQLATDEDSPWYSEAVAFEIADGDVSELALKARKAAIISGVVIVEGTSDPAVLAKVSQLSIDGSAHASGMRVKADGSFLMIAAGTEEVRVRLGLEHWGKPSGFSLIRVERDGVEQTEGIAVAPGEQVTGVRVIVGYYTGKIRGQLKIEGGVLPEGAVLHIRAVPVSEAEREKGDIISTFSRSWRGNIDSLGRFVIEGLPPGDYEVILAGVLRSANIESSRPVNVTKSVSVSNDIETEVTLVIDLSKKPW